jgi:uncharacterized protein (TIGR00290 family)
LKKIILSWSGGKDSALALFNLQQNSDYDVVGLLAVVFRYDDNQNYIAMHMINLDLIQQQADLMGLDLFVIDYVDSVSYEKKMQEFLCDCQYKGINCIGFGDIHLNDLRMYRESKLNELGIQAVFPLWNVAVDKILEQFFENGFKAIIINVDTKYIDNSMLGTDLSNEITKCSPIDICGENGEYHTLVYDAPMFKSPLKFELTKIISLDNANRFLSIMSKEKP